MKLSARHDIYKCGVFTPTSAGVGVSRTAREYWQRLFANDPKMQGMRKQDIHEIMAWDYANAEPLSRFKLRSGEKAEIRKSKSFYFVAAVRQNGQHDIIVLQPTWKEVSENMRSKKLSPDWMGK